MEDAQKDKFAALLTHRLVHRFAPPSSPVHEGSHPLEGTARPEPTPIDEQGVREEVDAALAELG